MNKKHKASHNSPATEKWMTFWEHFEKMWQNAPGLASATKEVRIHKLSPASFEIDWVLRPSMDLRAVAH